MTLTGLVFLFGITAAIWVFFDAPTHGESRWWAFGVFLLVVSCFPWYVVVRSRAQPAAPVPTTSAAPVTPPAPAGRWLPDPRSPDDRERYREGERWTRLIRPRQR